VRERIGYNLLFRMVLHLEGCQENVVWLGTAEDRTLDSHWVGLAGQGTGTLRAP